MCVQHGAVARVRPGVQSSSFLPSGLSGLSNSRRGAARDSKLPAGSAHPCGCGDPGGLSPPNLWGASVWAFPWQWGRNPVPLGLGKVRGGGKAVPLCALDQKQADPPWRRLCLSDVFPGFQRIFTHRELGVPPREPGSKQVRVCRGDEISHWRTLSMRTVK